MSDTGQELPPLPQSAEELFPTQHPMTADELFPKPEFWRGLDPQYTLDGPTFDKMFSEGGPGHILNQFGHGVKQGWGAEPLSRSMTYKSGPEDTSVEEWLTQHGIFNDWQKGQHSIVRAFNEALLRPIAMGLDLAFGRAPSAVVGGIGEVSPGAGALIEAFPGGHLTAFPRLLYGDMNTGLHSIKNLNEAAKLGLLDEKSLGPEPREVVREAFAPETTPPEGPAEPFVPEGPSFTVPAEGPIDVHAAARIIAPDVMERYDALAAQRDELKALAAEHPVRRQVPLEGEPTIEGAPSDVPLFEIARKIDAEIRAVEREMQDLAPQVTEAYREAARARYAETVTREPTPVPETLALPPEIMRAAEPNIQNLSQRTPTIAQDVAQQLRAAGRPDDEARAYGALQAAYFQTQAERFNGALGTARELYEARAPRVVRDAGGGRRGSINPATNVVTLFRNADASTYLHELGHGYLLNMQRDAAHPAAPAEFLDDWDTVKKWLRTKGKLTRGQQEKWAEGFERYMMEGQAPSPKLARVFEKFRQWLTAIYQYATQLRAPLNADIRGVYDRLLAKRNEEPVITPERAGAEDFADAHERMAREAPDGEATAAANTIRAEREAVAGQLSEETARGRRDARRGPERTSIPEGKDAGRESAAGGPTLAPEDAPIDEGRAPPTGKSKPATDGEFDPLGSELTDGHGNVRLGNLWMPEDIATAVRQAIAEEQGFATARRTPLTDADVLNLADALGMRAKDLMDRRIGEAWNAEQIRAAIKLVHESESELRDMMAKARVGDVQGTVDYEIAKERHLMLMEQLSGAASEAGRALRALVQVRKLSDPALINELLQRTVRKSLADLQFEAKMGMTLNTPAKLNTYIRMLAKPGWKDMVIEAWISSLLSGPYTHIRNLVGNVSVAVNSVLETAGAATVSKITGSNAVQFAEVGDRLRGLSQGSVEGIIAFKEAMLDEGYSDVMHVEQRFRRAIPDVKLGSVNVPLGQAIRMPLRMLSAEDEFFKAVAFRQEMNVAARRTARAEIEAGTIPATALDSRIAELLRDPTDLMVVQAKQHALYQTFQNELGPAGNAVIQWSASHPLARLIVPFVRTPTNIFKYTGERTPFGLASKSVRNNLLGRNGLVARDTQIAHIAIGSMFMTAIGVLAYNELVTGGGPARPEEMRTKRLTGWQPYSARIGDTYISYANLDPVSIHMGLAADIADLAKAGLAGEDLDKLAVMGVTLVARDVFGKLSLNGSADWIKVITEPAQYGPKFMQRLAGSAVPALLAQTAQTFDPFARDVRTFADTFRARTPSFRGDVEPRFDVWGQPIEEHNFGPINYSFRNHDPVNIELNRLGMGMAPAQRKINDVDLTPQQYADYARVSGQLAKQLLDNEVSQPWWAGTPDGRKKQLIHEAISSARDFGRAQVKMGSMGTPDDIPQKALEKRLEVLR